LRACNLLGIAPFKSPFRVTIDGVDVTKFNKEQILQLISGKNVVKLQLRPAIVPSSSSSSPGVFNGTPSQFATAFAAAGSSLSTGFKPQLGEAAPSQKPDPVAVLGTQPTSALSIILTAHPSLVPLIPLQKGAKLRLKTAQHPTWVFLQSTCPSDCWMMPFAVLGLPEDLAPSQIPVLWLPCLPMPLLVRPWAHL
jgi:hypothetical protein